MKIAFRIGLLFALILFSGCHSLSHKTQEKVAKINLVNDPTSLDPRKARDIHSQTLLRILFEGLTRINQNDEPELALASHVEISKDLKTYTFKIKNAKWSNGDPIRAGDFVYSWRKTLSPDFLSDNAFQLYFLKNAKEVKEGILPIETLGVQALDFQTLVVELNHPTPYFLELLSTPFFFPVNPKIDQEQPKWAEKCKTYVSNGPFCLEKWRHQDEIIIRKNQKYWDANNVQLDGVEFVMVDADVEMKLFEQKRLHWAGSPLSTISVDAFDSLRDSLVVKPKAETVFLRTNTQKSLLKNPKFRKALAFAIDRKSLVSYVLQGGQLPAMRLVPPSMQLQKEPYFENQDIEKANALFEEVLKEEGDILPKIHLTYISSERNHQMAQALQQQWREVLGIWIQLEAIERKVYFNRIHHLQFDLALCSWIADFHDPVNFLELFKYSYGGCNNTHWENQDYIEEINQSFVFSDSNKRFKHLAKCEQIIMNEMPIIPIFHNTLIFRKNSALKGVFLSSLGNLDLKWANLENEDE